MSRARKEQMGPAAVRSSGTSFLLWVRYKHGEACGAPTGPGQLARGRTEKAGARLKASARRECRVPARKQGLSSVLAALAEKRPGGSGNE